MPAGKPLGHVAIMPGDFPLFRRAFEALRAAHYRGEVSLSAAGLARVDAVLCEVERIVDYVAVSAKVPGADVWGTVGKRG